MLWAGRADAVVLTAYNTSAGTVYWHQAQLYNDAGYTSLYGTVTYGGVAAGGSSGSFYGVGTGGKYYRSVWRASGGGGSDLFTENHGLSSGAGTENWTSTFSGGTVTNKHLSALSVTNTGGWFDGGYNVKWYTNNSSGTPVLARSDFYSIDPGSHLDIPASTNLFGAGISYSFTITGPGSAATDYVPVLVGSGSSSNVVTGSTESAAGTIAVSTPVDSLNRLPQYTPTTTNQMVADRQNSQAIAESVRDVGAALGSKLDQIRTNSSGGSSLTNAPDYSEVLSRIQTNTLSSAQQLGGVTNLLTAVTNLMRRWASTNSVDPTATANAGEAFASGIDTNAMSGNGAALSSRSVTVYTNVPDWHITIGGTSYDVNPLSDATVAEVCAWVRYLTSWASAFATISLVYASIYAAILAVPAAQQTKGIEEQTPVVGTIGVIVSAMGFRLAIVTLLGAATVIFWATWKTSHIDLWNLALTGQPFGTGWGVHVAKGIWLLDQVCPIATVMGNAVLALGTKISLGAAVFVKTMAVKWFPS